MSTDRELLKRARNLLLEGANKTQRARLVATIDAHLSEPQAAAQPAGWKLVPIEPTPEMIDAACPVGEIVDHYDMATALRAAIAAAGDKP